MLNEPEDKYKQPNEWCAQRERKRGQQKQRTKNEQKQKFGITREEEKQKNCLKMRVKRAKEDKANARMNEKKKQC